jgi:hypothetical protein
MTTTHQDICIRIIRKGVKNTAKDDDVITVSRTYCNGTLKMLYKDRHNKSEYLTTLSESGFLRYLDTLFVLLENDVEPFESIQFSCPQYPPVMFKVYDVGRYTVQDSIKEAVKDTFASWKMNTLHEMWEYEDA